MSKSTVCLGVDARAARGPAGAAVRRCAAEVAQYVLFGRAAAPAKTTEASVYAFNTLRSENELHAEDTELGLHVVKVLRCEKASAPGLIRAANTLEWPEPCDASAAVVDCVGAMVAEAHKRCTPAVKKRLVLVTDDASCALWAPGADARQAKDDFKGMVERLVSQVAFGLCVIMVETGGARSPEAVEGAKLLKKACSITHKRGPTSTFFVRGPAADIVLLTQEACGRLEASKAKDSTKAIELKLAPGLTCYVTHRPLADEAKPLALKQQVRETGSRVETTHEYVRTANDEADPLEREDLSKAYYYGGEFQNCPPEVLTKAAAFDDEEEFGGVVLGCYDEALGSPWACGNNGGASGNRAQLLRGAGDRNRSLLSAFARSLRDQKQVAVCSWKQTKRSQSWRLACLAPDACATALVVTPLPYLDDVKPTTKIRDVDVPATLQEAAHDWCAARLLSAKDVATLRRADDPVVLNLQDLACTRSVEGDEEALHLRKKARFARLRTPAPRDADPLALVAADEAWRTTLQAWREQADGQAREAPGAVSLDVPAASLDLVDEPAREAPPPPPAEVTLRKRHALADFEAQWCVIRVSNLEFASDAARVPGGVARVSERPTARHRADKIASMAWRFTHSS